MHVHACTCTTPCDNELCHTKHMECNETLTLNSQSFIMLYVMVYIKKESTMVLNPKGHACLLYNIHVHVDLIQM